VSRVTRRSALIYTALVDGVDIPWRNFLSKFRVWDKVPEGSTLFLAIPRFP